MASPRVLDVSIDTDGMTPEQVKRAEELSTWMAEFFGNAITRIVPKAIKYGSADLELMGKAMLQQAPQMDGTVAGEELACWFYALGKVARLQGGYVQGGEAPDIDSWWDMLVYALMVHHIREFGEW